MRGPGALDNAARREFIAMYHKCLVRQHQVDLDFLYEFMQQGLGAEAEFFKAWNNHMMG